jgi:hypothetical protein
VVFRRNGDIAHTIKPEGGGRTLNVGERVRVIVQVKDALDIFYGLIVNYHHFLSGPVLTMHRP